jgi:hypothetical protein
MPMVMPQVALHRVIQDGVKILKQNPAILDDIFQYYTCQEMENDYGSVYIEKIKSWFLDTKIPVVQAWSLNPQTAPMISIRLANEQENESLAGLGDYYGAGAESEIGMSPSTVQLDIVIQTSRNGDESLWLYYIVTYILLKRKRHAESLGLELHTFSASDYNKNTAKAADNIWERYIRFKTTVQNFWDGDDYLCFDELEVELSAEGVPGGEKVKL